MVVKGVFEWKIRTKCSRKKEKKTAQDKLDSEEREKTAKEKLDNEERERRVT